MLIAKEKKANNIAEYILYMYQIEDLIRVYNFDIDQIEEDVVEAFETDPSTKEEIKAWYFDLIKKMDEQNIRESGHLEELKEIMKELSFLKNTLLNVYQDQKMAAIYEEAYPNIEAFRKKTFPPVDNEIEACLQGLYGLLLLKLQKRQITPETKEAMNTFSKMMAYLSLKYKEMKSGELDISRAQKN